MYLYDYIIEETVSMFSFLEKDVSKIIKVGLLINNIKVSKVKKGKSSTPTGITQLIVKHLSLQTLSYAHKKL